MACTECSLKETLPKCSKECQPCLSHPVTKSCALVGFCTLCLPVGLPLCIYYHCDQYICCKRCRSKSDIGFLTMLLIIIVSWIIYITIDPDPLIIFALGGVWALVFTLHVHGRRCFSRLSNLAYFLLPVLPQKKTRNQVMNNKNHLYYCCGMNLLLLLMYNILGNHPRMAT